MQSLFDCNYLVADIFNGDLLFHPANLGHPTYEARHFIKPHKRNSHASLASSRTAFFRALDLVNELLTSTSERGLCQIV